jgi:hypothetical protein
MLLSTDHGFFYALVAVPPGFGLSFDLSQRFEGPVRSGYILAKEDNIAHLPQGPKGFARVTDVPPYGALYRNLDAPCF